MLTEMGALIRVDPAKATAKIVDALRAARGNRRDAARALGLSKPRTLYRWIERLGLWERVDELARENGWPKLPRSSRAGERILAAVLRHGGDRLLASQELGVRPRALDARIRELDLEDEIARYLELRRSA